MCIRGSRFAMRSTKLLSLPSHFIFISVLRFLPSCLQTCSLSQLSNVSPALASSCYHSSALLQALCFQRKKPLPLQRPTPSASQLLLLKVAPSRTVTMFTTDNSSASCFLSLSFSYFVCGAACGNEPATTAGGTR